MNESQNIAQGLLHKLQQPLGGFLHLCNSPFF